MITVGMGYGSHLAGLTNGEHAGDEEDLEEKEEERKHRPVGWRDEMRNDMKAFLWLHVI